MLQNEKPKFRVTGNDLSTVQTKLARENLATFKDRTTLIEGDMLALDFLDSTFDARRAGSAHEEDCGLAEARRLLSRELCCGRVGET